MADSPRPFYTRLPILIALFAIFLVGVGAGVYFYIQSNGDRSILQNKQNPDNEVQQLVETVGKIYDLPKDEVPTIATVSDVQKLSEQEFFKRAQNGDKVLIYTKAKKAILYRPSTNKVVEVGPVNIDETEEQQNQATDSAQQSVSPTPVSVRVALYNGTQTAGLTRRFESDTLPDLQGVESDVTTRGNAAGDYTQTTIVDLTNGQNKDVVNRFVSLVKGSKAVNALPAGETRPANTDILIILGEDYAEAE